MEGNQIGHKLESGKLKVPDTNDLMSFSSPAVKQNILIPKSATMSPVGNITKISINSPSSPLKSPLAASTPFCSTKDIKINFPDESPIETADSALLLLPVLEEDPFHIVERKKQIDDPWEPVENQVIADPWEQVQVEVERQKCLLEPFQNDSPFDLVERKAQQGTDPWELAEAEAAKFIDQTYSDGGKSSTLDKAFVVDSGSKTSSNNKNTHSPTEVVTDKEFDIDNEVPPWDALDDSDDDLGVLVKRLSDEFPHHFATAEPLSDATIRNLSLVSPNPPRFSPIEFMEDLSLESPPLNLSVADMSFGPYTEKVETVETPVTSNKLEVKKELKKANSLKLQFGAVPKAAMTSKPLGTITNSGIVPRMPLKVASRLLKPKVYTNKENM